MGPSPSRGISAANKTPAPRLDALLSRAAELEVCRSAIVDSYAILHRCFQTNGKILLCGNGGSASDADHWSGERLKGFARARHLPRTEWTRLPPELRERLQGALPAIPLGAFVSASTRHFGFG